MIELNDFKRQWREIAPDVLAAIERVGAAGRYILDQEVARFEAELANYCHVAHAVGVGNGMDAIEIALRAAGLSAGERVLTTPFSAFATTLAIIRAGAVPVFVDVDDNGNIDLDQSRDVLRRDSSIRFFVPVHLYGNPLDLNELARIRRDLGVTIIEDCAQAIGATFGGLAVGSVGDAAALSFYPTKNLGTLGDGGAILTSTAALAQRARELRNYGQSSKYVHRSAGLNSRLDELHAAILHDVMLPRLPAWIEARRAIAMKYRSSLAAPVRTLDFAESARPVWHLFPAFVGSDEREQFRSALTARAIQTSVHYPRVIPDQPAMNGTACEILAEPRTARTLSATEVSLPIHPFLAESEVDDVICACRQACAAKFQPAS